MDYSILFASMGTALIYFIYKTHNLRKSLSVTHAIITDMALGNVEVKVNRITKEIDIKRKEDK